MRNGVGERLKEETEDAHWMPCLETGSVQLNRI